MSLNKSKSLRTAEKYVLQGKIPAAIDEYRKIVEADPGDLTTVNTLGDLYVRAGRIQDAIKNFSRIAESYREGGFTLKAIAMLKKISKLDPTNVDTAMKLANLYSQQGLLVEARQQYLQVADAFARTGQAHKALEAYQKIADLDPSNTSVRMKLGEIYVREGMREQAHEAFVTAGNELLRKNDLEQALTANLKAIAINQDSRPALTSLATIYTQQGQADKAINLLCDAFERSPGDTELLTILGRTYLASDWLDDAERTFLSLVELDRSRYHYLLEVGRRFLQLENLDRAAELVDGCIDILIAKREEDKAIDFLRRVLDRDIHHLGALKRLAQIFLRIREDHNLLATLNSVVEAAMKKGADDEAVTALKELVRLEPDEPLHRQRLQGFGVSDVSDVGGSGGYAYTSFGQAADEAYIIRQISEAEILAGLGQLDQAVENLNVVLMHTPDSIQIHLKLKDIYLRNGRMKDAAARCLELSRIHERRGETARASDYQAEAKHLYPDIHELQDGKISTSFGSSANALGFAVNYADSNGAAFDSGMQNGNNGFGFSAAPDSFGFTSADDSADSRGFGFEVFEGAQNHFGANGSETFDNWGQADKAEPAGEASFRYFDTIVSDKNKPKNHEETDLVFKSTGNLPTDTMPQILRDELEGIDFYIAQGYAEIAKDTLDRLHDTYGGHAEILARYEIMGITPPAAPSQLNGQAAVVGSSSFQVNEAGEIDLDVNEAFQESNESAAMDFGVSDANDFEPQGEAQADNNIADLQIESLPRSDSGEAEKVTPFLVHKDSGKLEEPDLMVQFNTAELLKSSEAMVADTADAPAEPEPQAMAEASLPEELATTHTVNEADALSELLADFDFTAASTSQVDEKVLAQGDEAVDEEPPTQDETGVVYSIDSSPLSRLDWASQEDDSAVSQEGDSAANDEALAVADFEIVEPATSDSIADFEVVEPAASEVDEPLISTTSELGSPAAPVEEELAASPVEEFETLPESVPQTESFSLNDLLEEEEEEGGLQQMLEDLIEDSDGITDLQDYETHYSLGLAYKDMELNDEAIEQFQLAFKLASQGESQQNHIECCHMLGFCFRRKYLPKVAVMWFQRGLQIPNSSENEYQALRYEIGSSYEEMGDTDKALDSFLEVYGIDVNYRDVVKRIRILQAIKDA